MVEIIWHPSRSGSFPQVSKNLGDRDLSKREGPYFPWGEHTFTKPAILVTKSEPTPVLAMAKAERSSLPVVKGKVCWNQKPLWNMLLWFPVGLSLKQPSESWLINPYSRLLVVEKPWTKPYRSHPPHFLHTPKWPPSGIYWFYSWIGVQEWVGYQLMVFVFSLSQLNQVNDWLLLLLFVNALCL